MHRFARPTFSFVVRVAAGLVVAAVFLYVAARAVVPDGTLTVSTDLHDPAPFVSAPKPSERLLAPVTEADGTFMPMVAQPVYLDLSPPSSFEQVDMTVTYKNDGQPMVELGALSSSVDGSYDMRPAQSLLLDGLDWNRVSSGDLTLLERRSDYASVDGFMRKLPPIGRIAVYHADVSAPARPAGYEPSTAMRTIDVSLRGSHRMYTYTDGEPVSFTFTVQDMNRQDGADPVIVSIYRGDGTDALARTVLEDDGNTSSDQRSSPLRKVSVSLADPSAGVYKIEFTAPDDVFIRNITTNRSKLVFADHLYLGDQVGYSDRTPPLSVYVTGARVTARTAHQNSVQTLSVDGRSLEVRDPNIAYSATTGAGASVPVRVTTPKRDVLLETDGVFAFSKAELFQPRPYDIAWYTDPSTLQAQGIDYLLTSYEPPTRDGDLVTATATFDFKDLARTTDGKYRFVIAAPGLAETQRSLKIARVTFTLRRKASGWVDGISRLLTPAPSGQGSTVAPDGRSFDEQVP